VKYFLLLMFLVLTSCSLNKNSTYWNEDLSNNSVDNSKSSKILKETTNFKTMTFDQFNQFLKNRIKKVDYPDINN